MKLTAKIFITLLIIIIPFFYAKGQENNTFFSERCAERILPSNFFDSLAHYVIISNKTDSVIKFLLEFEDNGFYDEITLVQKLLEGTDGLSSMEEKQFKVLDNIAQIVKSPTHRNFQLLFYSDNPGIINKMYSPIVMLSSFYDKQCHNFQRLAAQLALLTPFFSSQDFLSCHIENHNILNIRIGDNYIFHDFDPGQPGFRFKKDNAHFASFDDIIKDTRLVDKKQYYFYNDMPLSPWIPHQYYSSLFKNNYGCFAYKDLELVYNFVPNWVLPPNAVLKAYFPDTSAAANFGAVLNLDTNDISVRKALESYDKYLLTATEEDSLLVNEKIKEYLKNNYDFSYNINYVYLLNNNLIKPTDSTFVTPIMSEHFLVLELETHEDTVFFLHDFFIPLALHQVIIDKGVVNIKEVENTIKGTETFNYFVKDTLTFSLYNLSPPITTSDTARKPFEYNAAPLIFGPSDGYIYPNTKARFKFYYNPFYYAFHKQDFIIKYLYSCKNKLRTDF